MTAELKPEFITKMKEIEKQKNIRVSNFAKRYGLDKLVSPLCDYNGAKVL
ncbi:MAG TPA: hypothetical protein VJA18_05545 [Candidatus Nanoarchaeia archaeon]|nr:hypothetical protein [Candidatus Nanoarchaeia archaeon]